MRAPCRPPAAAARRPAARRAALTLVCVAVLGAVAPVVLRAHHGAPGHDPSRVFVVRATITAFLWQAPHSQVRFDAPDPDGVIRHWVAEAPPPNMLAQQGWHRRSLRAGDVVTLHYTRILDGTASAIVQKVVTAAGDTLWAYRPTAAGDTPASPAAADKMSR